MPKRFEIEGRLSIEQRKYFESYVILGGTGEQYSKLITDQKNSYIALSLVPRYSFLKQNRFQIMAGLSYSYLTKSLSYGETYVNGEYVGSASIDTKDGFEKYVVDALAGVGYIFPLGERFSCVIRFQGNCGLTNTIMQNRYKVRVNSSSLALAIRYRR